MEDQSGVLKEFRKETREHFHKVQDTLLNGAEKRGRTEGKTILITGIITIIVAALIGVAAKTLF